MQNFSHVQARKLEIEVLKKAKAQLRKASVDLGGKNYECGISDSTVGGVAKSQKQLGRGLFGVHLDVFQKVQLQVLEDNMNWHIFPLMTPYFSTLFGERCQISIYKLCFLFRGSRVFLGERKVTGDLKR